MLKITDSFGEEVYTAQSLAEAARIAVEEYGDLDLEIYDGGDFEGFAGDVYDELGLTEDD